MDGASVVVVQEYAVATVAADGTEYESGHIVVGGNHIVAGGVGPAPEKHARDARRIDERGYLAAPGLFNCHHLYQWPAHGLDGKTEEVAL